MASPPGAVQAKSTQKKRCPSCAGLYPFDYRVCPKDRTPLEVHLGDDDDSLIGDVLAGSFCIIGVIGEGGMGRVYEAEHVRLPRKYAVKIVAPELANSAEALGRMEREAQAAARIVHDNVLNVVDVVRARDGRPCLVTELLQGEELGVMLERVRKLPVKDAVDIARQVCRGLSAAHAQGIVHRDLKPENLYLCQLDDGARRVKVLDFGVAKMTDGANLTRMGTVVGTPAYMAPEQARGAPDVDGRADVYGVGAVLYRLVTGQPPFDGDDPARTLARVVMDQPRRPREIDPTIPDQLEIIILRAMAKSPAQRLASAADLEKQLALFADSLNPPVAAPVSAPVSMPSSAQAPIPPSYPHSPSHPHAQHAHSQQPYTPRAGASKGHSPLIANVAVIVAALTMVLTDVVFEALFPKPKSLAPVLYLAALALAIGAGIGTLVIASRNR
ncbi:MAG: protein kinase [Polyangiaceae bacterium]|nr:protein kinase [Polyangiaceae bacterium]